MGIEYNMMKKFNTGDFTSEFKSRFTQCKTRKDYFYLLQWVVDFYTNPQNEKEHMIFSILSVIYESCPEAFLDYVKDMDALEWQFITDAKIMFENNFFEQRKLDEWREKVLNEKELTFSATKTISEGNVVSFKRTKEV